MSIYPGIQWSNLEDKHRGLREYPFLLNNATLVGRDISVSNTRTGARKSIFDGADVAANVADTSTTNNIHLYSSMNGATNLVPENVSDHSLFGVTVSGELITEISGGSQHVTDQSFTATSAPGTITAEFKPNGRKWVAIQGSGSPNEFAFVDVETGTIGSESGGFVQGDIDWTDLGDGFYRVSLTMKTNLERAYFYLSPDGSTSSYSGDGASGMYIRNIRAIDSTVAHAPFPDGSAAAASYNTDLLSFTPTFGSAGTVAIPVTPYDYGTTANPATAQARLFSATGFEVYLDASGFVRTTGGAISTNKLTADTLSVVIATWDGTNQTISVDNETAVSVADTGVPSSTAYIGNLAAGTSPIHGWQTVFVYDYAFDSADIATFYTGITSDLSGVTTV